MEGPWGLSDCVGQSLPYTAAGKCSVKKTLNHCCIRPVRFGGIYFGSQSTLPNLP